MDIRDWLEGMGLGQYAEPFEALGIQPHEVPQLSEDDLRELGVASLVHRRRILQAVEAVDRAPASASAPEAQAPDGCIERVLTHFPFPIAYGYRRVVEPESASHAVDHVFYTYTALLRFAALTFLGQFLSTPGQNPQAAKALRRLQSPTLESWLTVATTLGKHLFPPLPGRGPWDGFAYAPFSEGGPFSPGLAAAVRQLSKLQRDGVQVHEQIRTLRNARAHGTPWDEAECARHLPGLRALLDAVLERFAPLGEMTLLRRSPAGLIRLVGANESFAEEPIQDPRIEDLFDESDTLLLGTDGALLPLYPLFLAPDADRPEGYTEPLLSFDGHGKSSAMYLGVRSWTARQDTLARYLDLLRAKDIDPRFTKADLSPWGVTDWARESSRGIIENLTGVKYFPEVYQERLAATGATAQAEADSVAARAEPADPKPADPKPADSEPAEARQGVDDAVGHWLEQGREPALIVAAEAGSGKTSLFCRLAEELLAAGQPAADRPEDGPPEAPRRTVLERPESATDCVLLLLGGSLRGRATLFERIRDGLGFSDDPSRGGIARFDELLAAWQAVGSREDLEHDERRILILIDALNEAEDPKPLFEELSQLAADAAAANARAGRVWVRLLVSVRAERIETLFARWGETSDTPFLQHPQNFAHVSDARGRQVPYLGLRRFTSREAEGAYAAAQRGTGRRCPAPWARLTPATQDLLRHPLMTSLFHQAYAGVEQPPALTGADTLWDAWLARTFDPAQGGVALEGFALSLADDCIDAGQDQIPPELAETWRRRWQTELGNDPIRIAAGLDPLERLAEAGILRRTEGGGLDWVSDSLAEQVLYLALRRRDPAQSESSLTAWLALPITRRLDGALSRVGAAIWRADRPMELLPVLGAGFRRGRDLMTEILLNVAPHGLPGQVEAGAADFSARLGQLLAGCIAKGDRRWIAVLKDSLLWDLDGRLADRWGYGAARFAVARHALSLAEHLKALEPENTEFLRDLSISYSKLGDLDGWRDPAAARDWFEQGLEIARRLAALEPENTQCLRDLSISYSKLGDLDGRRDPAAARDWFEQGLEIRRRLADLLQSTTELLDLSRSLLQLGRIEKTLGMASAEERYREALTIREVVVALEPDNHDAWCLVASVLGSLAEWHLGHGDAEEERAYSERANTAMERAAALKPDDPDVHYGLACTRARLGRSAQALDALARSVDLGYADADGAAEDVDLRSLQGRPEFKAILARMRGDTAAPA